MYLDAVSRIEFEPTVNNFHKPAEVFRKWKDWRASEISHHGKVCCEIAREWIVATDFSQLGGASVFTGPRWLREKFNWGASSFPIYWCEAVRKEKLDCGALAALAHEVFTARGVESYRVQMVQRFSEIATAQWSLSWSDGEQLRWTDKDLIYHEGCAIKTNGGDEIKVWDASAGWWVDAKSQDGYGALLAVRLTARENSHLIWGDYHLKANRWIKL
jgi:hypothetical protein